MMQGIGGKYSVTC